MHDPEGSCFFVWGPAGAHACDGQAVAARGSTITTQNGTRMEPTREVERLIAPSLEAMGFRVVQVRMLGGQSRPTLQIMAERSADGSMSVDDCADVSRVVSAVLDVEDPFPGAYVLEVSSPGIDRPLVRADDYTRFAGHEARIETHELVGRRKRFRGRILGIEGEEVRIALADDPEDVARIPLRAIDKAKLVLTDELIEASLKRKD